MQPRDAQKFDKLFKIRLLLDHLQQKYNAIPEPDVIRRRTNDTPQGCIIFEAVPSQQTPPIRVQSLCAL